MAAEFGVPKFGNDCASFEDLRRSLSLLDDALGNPTVPTDPDAPTKEIVTYDPDTGELSTPGGTVISGTGAVTVGCGLIQVGDAISVNYNSDTLECVNGVLNVLPLAGEILAVAPIIISGGNIVLETSDGLWVDGDDELAVRLATNSGLEFDGSAPGRLRDKWRYQLIKGQATANYHPSGGTIEIDNVTAIRGESPVTSSADLITVACDIPVWLDNNGTVYAKYAENPAISLSQNWSVCDALNLDELLKGIDDYDPAETQQLTNANGTIKWRSPAESEMRIGLIVGSISGATVTSSTISPGIGNATIMKFNGTNWVADTDIGVANDGVVVAHNISETTLSVPSGDGVSCVGLYFLDDTSDPSVPTFVIGDKDLRGLPNFDSTKDQAVTHNAGNSEFGMTEIGQCEDS